MHITGPRRAAGVVCIATLAACLVILAGCTSHPGSARVTSVRRSATDPGAPSGAGAGAGVQARQIAILGIALAHIRTDYARLDRTVVPGPQNVIGYRVGDLWKQGIDGAGTTVALLEGWTDPSLGRQTAAFDRAYDLPAPQVRTIFPAGPLPRSCPHGMQVLGSYGSCSAWGGELELDVLSVHLIAPYAHILLVVAPAKAGADAAESVAPPALMRAVRTLSARHLADVISVSDGSGESTYRHGAAEIRAQDPGELAAAAAGIPLLAATGDCGATQARAVNQDGGCTRTTPFRDVSSWADSPWVTAVGGSLPDLDPRTGARRGPDRLWRWSAAGLSKVFARPRFQNRVASITHSAERSLPDITMDGDFGTSQSAPLLAGVLALATQENGGEDIGPINPALYELGPAGTKVGIEDVRTGNDTFTSRSGRRVPGYAATRGFDIASGWGTVDAPRFVPSLVAMTRRLGEERSAREQAEAALRARGGPEPG